MSMPTKLHCVLFDLDGTLVDTAPDLIASLNYALQHHGFDSISTEAAKPFISLGASAMINASQAASDNRLKTIIQKSMLDFYQQNIAQYSVFFDGILETLTYLENHGLKWGVVTNKHQRFTVPLMAALGLTERASCIISGDSTPHAKPHPEPLLTACRQTGADPKCCIYIGDAKHDITAGNAAQMITIAALYGYLNVEDQPESWEADAMIHSANDIPKWINSRYDSSNRFSKRNPVNSPHQTIFNPSSL